MEKSPLSFLIVAGETSGDQHGAHLVTELRKLHPQASFAGIGGPNMAQAGVDIMEDLTQKAVVGFVEVLKHYGYFRKIFKLFIQRAKKVRPTAVILIDYPGFNLRLAKALKKLNIKVIYYISPQIWAWKEQRVKLIKKYVDRMIVIFPFEKDFYARRIVDVAFVGHPFLDSLTITKKPDEVLKFHGLSTDKLTIGILPGSREKEIERHLPVMLEAAKLLCKEMGGVQFIVIRAPSIDMLLMEKYFRPYTSLPIKVVPPDGYNALNACHLCIISSGTATFEAAMLLKPMVVVYKTSPLTYLIARLLISIPHIGMANVLAGKQIVPECIQGNAHPEKIAQELRAIFTDELRIAEIKKELQAIRDSMGEPGASRRAAQEILKVVGA